MEESGGAARRRVVPIMESCAVVPNTNKCVVFCGDLNEQHKLCESVCPLQLHCVMLLHCSAHNCKQLRN